MRARGREHVGVGPASAPRLQEQGHRGHVRVAPGAVQGVRRQGVRASPPRTAPHASAAAAPDRSAPAASPQSPPSTTPRTGRPRHHHHRRRRTTPWRAARARRTWEASGERWLWMSSLPTAPAPGCHRWARSMCRGPPSISSSLSKPRTCRYESRAHPSGSPSPETKSETSSNSRSGAPRFGDDEKGRGDQFVLGQITVERPGQQPPRQPEPADRPCTRPPSPGSAIRVDLPRPTPYVLPGSVLPVRASRFVPPGSFLRSIHPYGMRPQRRKPLIGHPHGLPQLTAVGPPQDQIPSVCPAHTAAAARPAAPATPPPARPAPRPPWHRGSSGRGSSRTR